MIKISLQLRFTSDISRFFSTRLDALGKESPQCLCRGSINGMSSFLDIDMSQVICILLHGRNGIMFSPKFSVMAVTGNGISSHGYTIFSEIFSGSAPKFY